ncbi:MAG: LysM peptidoglycan-binding domain-containing protein [Myxococcales bacterium]|nr:LysM peptidoglycan-binding domain-containing protein [Myxococcales bacterium]
MLPPNAQSRPPRERLGETRDPGGTFLSNLRQLAGVVGVTVALYGAVALAREEPTKPAATTGRPEATPGPGLRIKVAKGETAIAIARRHGTSVRALCDANGLTDPHRIYAGQVLTIPVSFDSGGETTALVAAPTIAAAAPAEPARRRPSVTAEPEPIVTDVQSLGVLAAAPSTSAKLVVRPAPLTPRARLDASRFERFGVVVLGEKTSPRKTTLVHGAFDVTEPLRAR